MSNNSLPCSKCRGQHHPADECSEPDRTEAAKLLMFLSCYDTHYYTPKKFDADVELIMDELDAVRKEGFKKGVEYGRKNS